MTVNPVRDQMTTGQLVESWTCWRTSELTGSLIEVRENSVQKRVDRKCDEVVGNINQELVPALGHIILVVDGN